ncbi:hypothetical protein ACJX0J_008312, partial [Zea mays]
IPTFISANLELMCLLVLVHIIWIPSNMTCLHDLCSFSLFGLHRRLADLPKQHIFD